MKEIELERRDQVEKILGRGTVLGSWVTEHGNELLAVGGTCSTPDCSCATATLAWLRRPRPSEARDFHETVRPEVRRRLAQYLERPLPLETLAKAKPKRWPLAEGEPEVVWRMSFDVPK